MKAFGRVVPAAVDTALHVITFSDDATFHFNGSEIRIMHLPLAHTDGDSGVLLADANVLHLGDTFFNGFYPFIDQSGGGTLERIINAASKALELVDDQTKIIPNYHDMLLQVRSLIRPLVEAGQSRQQVIDSNPLAPMNDQWGNGFMKPEVFTGIVFDIESGT